MNDHKTVTRFTARGRWAPDHPSVRRRSNSRTARTAVDQAEFGPAYDQLRELQKGADNAIELVLLSEKKK
jgi:hypothetical protein